MSINDRASWPSPAQNPLIALLKGDDEWIDNQTLAIALDPSNLHRRRSLVRHWPDLDDVLGPETAMRQGDLMVPWKQRGGRGIRRVYSRKALVLIAMRAQTRNAAAFRDWLAGEIAAGRSTPASGPVAKAHDPDGRSALAQQRDSAG